MKGRTGRKCRNGRGRGRRQVIGLIKSFLTSLVLLDSIWYQTIIAGMPSRGMIHPSSLNLLLLPVEVGDSEGGHQQLVGVRC